ncbi:variable large family protein (plasmid) [Borrelia puertoricensis]|nr:variable large family protein [Borrelia puertoricensis]
MDAESKNTCFDSLVKIGHGFYEIFGNAIGDALGLTAVKSGDKKSKVGEHFKTVGNGLTTTKEKLKELSDEISGAKNVNGSTIKLVEDAIKGANDVFVKLIDSVTKLSGVTNDGNPIGDTASAPEIAADKDSVETVIKEVKAIIETAKESGVKIDAGEAGNAVEKGDDKAGAVIVGKDNNNAPAANTGPALAAEVAKADPWAMIDKINNTKVTDAANTDDNNDAATLATKLPNAANKNGAVTNADLAAAVALKAMTKNGKFSANAADTDVVKAAAVTAVNKVLGILDLIIRKTVVSHLDKIREAIKGIQYSEITTETTETSSTQPTATK